MNAWTTIAAPLAPALDPAVELERKRLFAEALLRAPGDAFSAARTVFGQDTMGAMVASQQWPYDMVVLQRQAELLETFGPDEYLPAKHEVARRIWDIGQAATDTKDRLAAFKLYADLRGFMPRSEGMTINNTVNQNRVMIMRDFGTDEQWETAAAGQQAKLIEHSRD